MHNGGAIWDNTHNKMFLVSHSERAARESIFRPNGPTGSALRPPLMRLTAPPARNTTWNLRIHKHHGGNYLSAKSNRDIDFLCWAPQHTRKLRDADVVFTLDARQSEKDDENFRQIKREVFLQATDHQVFAN
jgi:hypothetical protein